MKNSLAGPQKIKEIAIWNHEITTEKTEGSKLLNKGDKSKNKQMGLYQTKKLLWDEENHHKNEKAMYWMWQDISKLYVG